MLDVADLLAARPRRKFTLLGRAILLVTGELLANAICWIAAALALRQADGLLGLALLAWTLGLRHALDADHISAIDNATRQLVSYGQLPITCGLWFSLGHSTIVIVVNVAIAISVDIYDKLDRVGSVGGIVGAAVSGTFLFLIACINIYFLTQALKDRRRIKSLQAAGLPIEQDVGKTAIHGGGCMVRVVGPILRAVDKPWKMYPVGVLFGFGFDTASSIALLAISALAQKGADGESVSHGRIVILPFLFTAGMTLVDSLDSILMLYAYASPSASTPEGRFAFFQDRKQNIALIASRDAEDDIQAGLPPLARSDTSHGVDQMEEDDNDKNLKSRVPPSSSDERYGESSTALPAVENEHERGEQTEADIRARRLMDSKANVMSSLSITLTVLSILVALSISLITIMGLIGENCESCQAAADDPDGGGLAGSWWRGWANANDQSGYIGAAIVGCFAAILLGYHGSTWAWRRYKRSKRRAVQMA